MTNNNWPNHETELAFFAVINDRSTHQKLEEIYKRQWMNIMRLKRLVRHYWDREHLLREDFYRINWPFIFVEIYNYFANTHGDELMAITLQPSTTDSNTNWINVGSSVGKHNVEEQDMSDRTVNTRTFFGDENLEECSDDVIFDFIRRLKKRITSLEPIAEESKAAQKQIDSFKKEIKKLADYVDKRG